MKPSKIGLAPGKLNSFPNPAPTTRRNRARYACINCRRRKVRCDLQVTAGRCTNCTLNKTICQTYLSRPLMEKMGPNRAECTAISSHAAVWDEKKPKITKEEEFLASSASTLLFRSVESREDSFADKFTPFRRHDLRGYLVGRFLRFIYPTFPVTTLFQMASIVTVNEEDNVSCDDFVMYALLAASVTVSDRQELCAYGVDSKEEAFEFFYSNAKSLFPQDITGRSYAVVQGLLLMGHCETRSSQETFFWLGIAHAVAISLQLDQDPASIPQPESGLRKRLWWCLFSQMMLLKLTTGTSSAIEMKNACVSRLNDEDFEYTIPALLLDDARKLAASPCGYGDTNIAHQFLHLLDFFDSNQGGSESSLCSAVGAGRGIKAPRATSMRNHMKSEKGDLAGENHVRATLGHPFLLPEDDPKITSLVSDIEQQLFSSTFGSRQNFTEGEFDRRRHEDYFGYGR